MGNNAMGSFGLSSCSKGNRLRWALLVVLALNALTHLAWFAVHGGHELHSDEVTYDRLATNWLYGDVGMSLDGENTSSFVGPVYPAFLAAVYAIFGHEPRAVFIFQILFAVVTAYLVYCIGRKLVDSEIVSVVAVGALTLYFPLIEFSSKLLTETLFTMLLALTVLLLLSAIERKSATAFAVAGIATGVTVLCRPVIAPLPLFLFIGLLISYGHQRRLNLTSTAIFTLMMLLAIAPWTMRNYVVWNTIVPFTTDGGKVLWAGNFGNDGRRPDPLPEHVQRYLDRNPSETERNSFYMKEAITNITADPANFARLGGKKFLRFWFNIGYPEPPSRLSLALFLAHVGLWLLAMYSFSVVKNRPGLLLILLIIANFTLVHVVTLAVVRYSMPLMPYVILLACAGLARFFARACEAHHLPSKECPSQQI